MADGLNCVHLLGNLGADPEFRVTQGGGAILKLRLATSESWLDKAGTRQEKTEWHTVVLWGKRAEALSKILAKGARIFVDGSLQTRSWEDQQGQKRYATEVNAKNIILSGGGGGGGGAPGGGRQSGGGFRDKPSGRQGFRDDPGPDTDGAELDDDIPF